MGQKSAYEKKRLKVVGRKNVLTIFRSFHVVFNAICEKSHDEEPLNYSEELETKEIYDKTHILNTYIRL